VKSRFSSYDLTGLPGCPQCTGPTVGSSKPTKQIDANGKVLYWAYDGLDRLIINIHKQGGTSYFINPTDAVNRHTYDANSNHTSMTEPDRNTTTYSYDALNREVQMVNAAGDTTKQTYDPVGNLASVTYPTLNVTTNSYDALNRPIQQSDSAGNVGTLTFDPAGNITSVTYGNGKPETFAYDADNRVISMTDPLCAAQARPECPPTQFAFDAEGNQLSTSDRNRNVENYSYDAINRPTSVTNSLGNTSQSHYDGVGNLTQMTDGNGHMTTVTYDAVNRPISLTYADPSHNTVTWTYDNVGHVRTRTDQKSQVTSYTYSDLYFVTARTYFPSGSTDTFTYDLSGRVLTQTHGGWTDTFTYDGANRVLISTQNGQTVSYAYNIPGRTRTITYPGGRTITEQMDFRSRISTVNDGGPKPIVQYAYDQANNILMRAFRNGTVATYTYNPNNWVFSLDHTLGPTRFLGFQYGYDAEGNQIVQNRLNAPADSETFTSNAIYQLTDYKTGVLVNNTIPKPITQTAYTLDPVGNWETTLTCIPGSCSTQTRTHSPSNEITSINGSPLISDYNGNLSDDGTALYFYDEENRLTKAVDKASGHVLGQYQYDALGKRVSTIDTFGIHTFYYYDGWRTIEEQSSLGLTQATYVFGNDVDEVLTMDRVLKGGSQTFYYHQNALHSVFALTNFTGSVVEAYEYDAYGSHTVIVPGRDGLIHYDARDVHIPGGKSSYGNPFFFTGQRYDAETGLMYYKQRYYSATLGRFMSRDPIGIWTDLANIGNGYAYVGDNPATWTDPFGTRSKSRFWNWVRKAVKDVEAAAKSVAQVVIKVAKYVDTADKLLKAGVMYGVDWIEQASLWIRSTIPEILKFIELPLVQSVLTAIACYNFVTDVVNIAKHGLQPTNIPSFLLGNNGNVNIQGPGGSSSSLTPVQAGDIVTVVSDISTGISCVKGLVAFALF
jgi:RHS repeat-associated protein